MAKTLTPPMTEIVEAATRAPSSHNTQPWLFEQHGNELLLFADRTRRLPVNDPNDRELIISCGAALFNLEVAARHFGFRPEVTTFPVTDADNLVAQVLLVPETPPTLLPLFEAIPQRRTTREPFDTTVDLPSGFPHHLLEAVEVFDVQFHLVPPGDREALAELVEEGDRLQFSDPQWRHELAHWMHPRRTGDGLEVPPVIGLATRVAVSSLDLGRSTAAKDHRQLVAAPLVVSLSTVRDTPSAWVETGRALERMLLAAAIHDVQVGYLNQPCQVAPLRAQLAEFLELDGFPQVVLRMGHLMKSRAPSARRPVSEVFTEIV